MHKILWFSGTGNSLYVAQEIALFQNEEVQLYKITPSFIDDIVNNQEGTIKSDVIGLVFPVYGFRCPQIIDQIIEKISLKCDYLYVVTTMGGQGFNTISYTKNKGLDFNYFSEIKMPDNCIYLYNPSASKGEEVYMKIIKESQEAIKLTAKDIKYRLENKSETTVFGTIMTSTVGGAFRKSQKGMDKRYNVSEKCISCGKCEQVCPSENIELIDGKVTFKGNCSVCMACIHWCPTEAINYKNKTQKRTRYHNPMVSFSEMTTPIIKKS